MWILDYPINDDPNASKKSHLLNEAENCIIGRSVHAQYGTNKKKISKIQFVLSFSEHNLILDNRGKGRFNLNDEYIPNGKCYEFKRDNPIVRDLHFSFRSEPFEFRVYYKPFVISDEDSCQALVSHGFPAEYNDDQQTINYYLLKSTDTLGGLMDLCERNITIHIVTRDFVEQLQSAISDLYKDFKKYWPYETPITVYSIGDKLHGKFNKVNNVDLYNVEEDEISRLSWKSCLWNDDDKIQNLEGFKGLLVGRDTIVYDMIWRKEDERKRDVVMIDDEEEEELDKPSPKRLKVDRSKSSVFSGLKTMMNFGADDDFEVIKTEEPEKPVPEETNDDETNIEPLQSERSESERSESSSPSGLKKTEFLKVDVSNLAGIPNSEDNSPKKVASFTKAPLKKLGNQEDSLVHAFQEAKKEKEQQAEQDDALLEKLDSTGKMRAKVTRFKIQAPVGVGRGPRVYQPAAHEYFADPRWANRVDFSRFHKANFLEGNPITDSTVKGIKMHKAQYQSGGLSAAEKEMIQFNDGIKDLDQEFEGPRRGGKRKRTNTDSGLFVDSDPEEFEDLENDAEEPSYHRRNHKRTPHSITPNLITIEDSSDSDSDDDIPSFKRRARH